MTSWDEIRTAFEVARHGTVSGAAEALGVHHATVIRHVDALEARLGAKLFQRHARGYTPTEAGRDLLRVGEATDDQIAQLVGRIRGQGEAMGGELIVTSLVTLAPRVTPVLVEFQALHPGVAVRYLAGERLFRLEYGEAHVAIRAGVEPSQPDAVVQPFVRMRCAAYAGRAYWEGSGGGDLTRHRLVGVEDSEGRAPFSRWLAELAPGVAPSFTVRDDASYLAAVAAGAGVGMLPMMDADARPDLVRVAEPRPEWTVSLWLVTHVDLHRSPKVQAALRLLKERAAGWGA